MSPSVHGRSPLRRYSSDRSDSPIGRHSSPPRRRSSPRKERSPQPRSSPRTRSPTRIRSSHRARSPPRDKVHGRDRSPKHAISTLPVSRSPSPHSKRLRRAQAEREGERAEREREKNSSRDENRRASQKNGRPSLSMSRSPSPRTNRLKQAQAEREKERERERNNVKIGDKGRHREKGAEMEVPIERRSTRDKNDGGSSRSRDSRHGRSTSPMERGHRSSQSPPRRSKAGTRDEATNTGGDEQRDVEHDSVSKMKAAEEALEAKQKQKPSYELSGKLAEETNRVRGVTLLFNEPPDAQKPNVRWRLYVFKAGEVLNEPLYVHRQSCYLFGRERRVADIPTDHPSCSKQHAVIQYRLAETEKPDGMMAKQVRPYLMDLGSTNGTFINDNRIEPQRYYELFEKDTIRFGNSSREYVILHENSAE